MRICVIGYGHSVSDVRVYEREVRSLTKAGHVVTIVARQSPNIRPVWFGCFLRPHKFREDGIDHVLIASRPTSMIFKILSEPVWCLRYLFSVCGLRADAYHCHEPQSLLIGWMVAKFRGADLVYDCHEYQSEAWADMFPRCLRNVAFRFFRFLEGAAARSVSAVVTVNSRLVDRFVKDCPRTIEVPNYPLWEQFGEVTPQAGACVREKYRGKRILIYHGAIFEARGLLACVRLMGELVKRVPNALLLVIGPPPDAGFMHRLMATIDECGVSGGVELLPWMQPQDLIAYLCAAELGLFLPDPTYERYRHAEPVKFFEYAASWTPVVLSDVPALHSLVDISKNGILVDPRATSEMANDVADLLESAPRMQGMMDSGRRIFEERYNWDAVSKRLIDLYDSLGSERESNTEDG